MEREKQDFDTEELELGRQKAPRLQRIAASRRGMVATAHDKATEAAAAVLKDGGNAVDAAVTAAFALGVCEPAASGLGGQTMALLYLKDRKQTVALDGSSRAPHRVPPGQFEKKELLRGHRAATVPSTPAVHGYLLRTYGTLPLTRVLKPAIELAEEGYRITELKHSLLQREVKHLRAGSASLFFLKNSRTYPFGLVFRQPVLATTLRRLSEAGIEDFYQDGIARDIHDDMEENKGFIHDDDLAQIPWPIARKPLTCRFNGLRVHTFGEPGAGRTLIEMLNVVEKFPPPPPQSRHPLGSPAPLGGHSQSKHRPPGPALRLPFIPAGPDQGDAHRRVRSPSGEADPFTHQDQGGHDSPLNHG